MQRRLAELVVRLVAFAVPLVAIVVVVMPREHTRVVQTTTTIAVPVVTLLPYERAIVVASDERAGCPIPRHDAPRAQPAQPPELVGHVRPAVTNAGWIAAWNEEHVFISMDAGRSWTRMLDGKGIVRDVTFDCFGRVIAVRGDRVGTHDGVRETWHPIPGKIASESYQYPRLLGGGPDIVVIGHTTADDLWRARLAIHRGSWETHDITHYWNGVLRGRQYEDGSIVAMVPLADCMHDDPRTFRYRDGVIEWIDVHVAADLAIYGDLIVSHYGWQRIGDKDKRDLVGLDRSAYPTIIEGPSPMLAVGTKTYRFDEGRITPLPYLLDDNAESIVADAAGRIWSVVCGEPRIATRATPVSNCEED